MNISIKAKTTLLVIIAIILVSATSVIFFANEVKVIEEEEFTNRSIRLAETVALALDTDQVAKLKEDVLETYCSADDKVSSEEWGGARIRRVPGAVRGYRTDERVPEPPRAAARAARRQRRAGALPHHDRRGRRHGNIPRRCII